MDVFAGKAPGLERYVARFNRKLVNLCVRMNELQVIGSHNSYHVEPVPELIDLFLMFDPEAIAWEYTHPPLAFQFEAQGIRQIELDVFADPDGGLYANRIALSLIGQPIESNEPALDEPGFKVLHVQHADFDTTCLTFVACLEQVKAWSDANPDHLPIMILVEAKDEGFFEPVLPPVVEIDAARFRELDAEILSVFPEERILLPDDVRRGYATLEEAVLDRGWPTVGKVRGKVIFALDNGGGKSAQYRDGADSLEGRILFTNASPGDPDAAFVKVNDPLGDATLIPDLVSAGYVVRTRADSDTEQARTGDVTQRDAALASGAQWVSTDYADPDPRFGTGYSVELPGGGAGRCNPVLAPPLCRDEAVAP
ncbi:MAG: hypothetical protein HKP30_07630 [Myxococcales bacterium]|nr:hypothetical protein [Myxococcales bacterium]